MTDETKELTFYIGCQVLAKDPALEEDHQPVRGILTGIHGEYGPEVAFFDTPHHTRETAEYPGKVVVILRPLDELREEEARHIWESVMDIKGYKYNHVSRLLNSTHTALKCVPIINGLRRAFFDVDDLHSAGLCVYENEVKLWKKTSCLNKCRNYTSSCKENCPQILEWGKREDQSWMKEDRKSYIDKRTRFLLMKAYERGFYAGQECEAKGLRSDYANMQSTRKKYMDSKFVIDNEKGRPKDIHR